MDDDTNNNIKEVEDNHNGSADDDMKARVDAVWEQMNSNFNNNKKKNTAAAAAVASKKNNNIKKKITAATTSSSSSSTWMKTLGLNNNNNNKKKNTAATTTCHDQSNSKHIAAAALAALNNPSSSSSPSPSAGKIQITQIKDFAGQPIQLHKLVDAHSKEASANNAPSSAVDAVLDQIKKKQKLSVLDKTKLDWGDYKGENKGLEHELDAYKKSSNQYLDKLSFLERADYREFERERDARLALHSRKRSDTT